MLNQTMTIQKAHLPRVTFLDADSDLNLNLPKGKLISKIYQTRADQYVNILWYDVTVVFLF